MAKDDEPRPEETIDATFRNGSLTAIGVVSAFSLGFVTRWAAEPGKWSALDVVALVAILVGIGLQISALVAFLSVRSLRLDYYNRYVRMFTTGTILAAAGILIAVTVDVIGLLHR